MKIIAVGDPHFRQDNLQEVTLFIDRLVRLAKDEDPDVIVILGDVLHTHERLHTSPLNKALEMIEKMSLIAKTYVLVGNHDYINNQQFLTEAHWLNGIKKWKNVEVADKVLVRKHLRSGVSAPVHPFGQGPPEHAIVLVPYVAPGRFLEALNTESGWKSASCIFAHQEFYGAKMGAIASVEGDKWPENFPHVISGHIHGRQVLQKNVYYCGSSMQHAFGESDKNVIPIITLKEGGYDLREVDLDLPRKKIIYTELEDISECKIPTGKDQVKISVSGEYSEFKSFRKTKEYKDLTEKGVKVVFKPKKISKKDVEVSEDQKPDPGCDAVEIHGILHDLVLKEKNPELYSVYELVVNGKEVSPDDFLFI